MCHVKKIMAFLALLFLISCSYAASQPKHVALVDTGYDACIANQGSYCEQNKNLLFRGGLPLLSAPSYSLDLDQFRKNIFAYLTQFNKTFATKASLPASLADLSNYRIVVINLLYDYSKAAEGRELEKLQYEFLQSGHVATLQLPKQHVMYGLETPFHSNQYAFEWWPVMSINLSESNPLFVSTHLNWPDKQGTPEHSFKPAIYQALNFPYLITGKSWKDVKEVGAKDLATLLKTLPKDGHPLLIFYHCTAGKDRTGAVSAAYFMTFGGYPYYKNVNQKSLHNRSKLVSFAQALKLTTLPKRPPNAKAVELAKAYCLSLKKGSTECDERI